MKLNKTFIISLLLLCLLIIAAVSAADNDIAVNSDLNDNTITSIQDDSGETSIDAVLTEMDTKTVSNNKAILKEDGDDTSFNALNQTINEATGSE